ncbi:MAG: hypothetical protein ABEJ93_05140 [Candidatus Nanohalobium sp.]
MKEDFPYIFRIVFAASIIPVLLLISVGLVEVGKPVYSVVPILMAAATGLGILVNLRRVRSEDKLDRKTRDEINHRSAANAFWATINLAIIAEVFRGIITDITDISLEAFQRYDLAAFILTGLTLYYLVRAFYMHYGLNKEFWRWRPGKE